MRTVTLKTASEVEVGDVISSVSHSGLRLKKAKIIKVDNSWAEIKLWFGDDFYKWCRPSEEFILEKE